MDELLEPCSLLSQDTTRRRSAPVMSQLPSFWIACLVEPNALRLCWSIRFFPGFEQDDLNRARQQKRSIDFNCLLRA
jgi:hypothetical protein